MKISVSFLLLRSVKGEENVGRRERKGEEVSKEEGIAFSEEGKALVEEVEWKEEGKEEREKKKGKEKGERKRGEGITIITT